MKTMTCNQLGRACNMKFTANSFEEIAEQSKKHSMEMIQQGDPSHIAGMDRMRELMTTPDAMQEWFNQKRNEFDALPG